MNGPSQMCTRLGIFFCFGEIGFLPMKLFMPCHIHSTCPNGAALWGFFAWPSSREVAHEVH
jgi:hypothetical protein